MSMKLGSITLHHGIALAPMEEHTHLPFRLMARQYGAGLMFTERVDGDKVTAGDRRALRQLATEPAEQPCIAQVSATDPEIMAAAARVIEDLGFAGVDLNCDCPVNRVVARGEGGALMADPAAIARLVVAAVKAVRIPVTVFRAGRGTRARGGGGPTGGRSRRRGARCPRPQCDPCLCRAGRLGGHRPGQGGREHSGLCQRQHPHGRGRGRGGARNRR